MAKKQKLTVHELFVALSQCEDRGAAVTVKEGKIHVGGKPLKDNVETEGDPEAGADDKDHGGSEDDK